MADIFYDRVCETSTSTGTGNFTLAGAVTGFQTFNGAGVGSTDEIPYLIEAVDTNGVPTGDWEAGIGLLSTTTTLQRIVVTASSNSGSLVSFAAGTKRVHLSANAGQLSLRGGTYSRGTDLTAQNYTTATAIPWNNKAWEFEPTYVGFHSTVTNPSRILLPDGYDTSLMRFSAQVALANITVGDWVELKVRADGGSTNLARATFYVPTTTPVFQLASQVIFGGAANYYELFLQVGADTSVDVKANESWFQFEVLQ